MIFSSDNQQSLSRGDINNMNKNKIKFCNFKKFFVSLSNLLFFISLLYGQQYTLERMWPVLEQPWYFFYPTEVAVDSLGNIYIADNVNNCIQKLSSDGTFITKWGSEGSADGQFNRPFSIAIDTSGYIYVADTYNHRIQKFTSDGTFITKWGSKGTGDGEFDEPYGIAVDTMGYVYVADTNNHRIQKFTSDGIFITKWGSQGLAEGQFKYPFGIAVDTSGYVYVADSGNHRIQKFTSDGTFISKWGKYGSAEGEFNYPTGIAVDRSGNVYVTDMGNHRIQKFVPLTDSARPTIFLSESSLSFSAIAGGNNPSSKTFTITNTGDVGSILNWTTSVNASWLTILPTSGSLSSGQSATVTVSVNITGLSTGTYNATITVVDPNAGNSPQVINVSLVLTSPQWPIISLSTNSLNFSAVIGGANPASQTFTITNTGDANSTLDWTATDDAAWLTISPTSGSLGKDNSATVTVSVDITGLSTGTYNATITISDPNATNSPQTVSVTLNISSQQTFYIKGYVKDSAGVGISGVNVTLSGAASATYTTDSTGYYEFINLVSGNYTVRPTKPGWSFSPAKRDYTPLNSNKDNEDFVGVEIKIEVSEGEAKIQGGEKGYIKPDKNEIATILVKPKKTGTVNIKIYTLRGQLVWEKTENVQQGIQNVITWACENIDREKVASGIYIVHIKGAGLDIKKKIAVVK